VTFVHEWAGRKKGQRLVSGASLEDSAASLWRLFTSVWGEEGEGGPPSSWSSKTVSFLSDATVELLQLILASELPSMSRHGWLSRGRPLRVFPQVRRIQATRAPGGTAPRAFNRGVGELIRSLHPGTSGQISAVVSRRFGMNPTDFSCF